MSDINASILQFCSEVGADPLMVQGAGGNVSWKEGDTLWIKASGTWLSEANINDIFVAVDYFSLKQAIHQGNYSAPINMKHVSKLKPSIETMLHALVPSKVVVHLHSIEILSHLVRDHCEMDIARVLEGQFRYALVNYYKPGADLAAAVSLALKNDSSCSILFLKNHGIVIGGQDVEEVRQLLYQLTQMFHTPISSRTYFDLPVSEVCGYVPVIDMEIHRLAIESQLMKMVQDSWALYPDHVVFLGPKPYVFSNWDEFRQTTRMTQELPELIFIKNKGVFVFGTISRAKRAQLRCYYDVLSRQTLETNLKPLSNAQVDDILNWDAEKYRMLLAKDLSV
ncbi:short chain dehydrogenase [Legionella sainthelensi]|uniref:class II aldolase/adducin family protein n=1 Tax=Legionella sainthelensi TaxID=28087 RepID=UPI000F71D696|nr:class II aldolase/adducin family protein [Legionella sainthelensi]VEB38805.1 short chain dehydrogenase [Legionella sainthelensi]